MKQLELPSGKLVSIATRPWWLFWVMPGYTITLSPMIYTTKELYNKCESRMDIWVHEGIHLRQQSAIGKWKFYWQYATNRSFRYRMEFEAYLTQFKFEISERRNPNVQGVAEALSSVGYLWCVKKEKAIADFTTALTDYKATIIQ